MTKNKIENEPENKINEISKINKISKIQNNKISNSVNFSINELYPSCTGFSGTVKPTRDG